jgi:3-hydroxyacyl-[acyl-carrier-protein] dehydratase
MLAGKLYTTGAAQTADDSATYTIQWNAQHPIFEGHFPGRPVVPGVCMMQTIKELLERTLDKKVVLRKAASMKFLNMIDPNANPEVTFQLQHKQQEGEIKVTATIKHEALTFMKFQGTFADV